MRVSMVRYYRIKNGYKSVKELADKIGYTREHLNQVELGKQPLSGELAIKLSSLFDIKVDELYGEKIV